jgi:hypothetical protein
LPIPPDSGPTPTSSPRRRSSPPRAAARSWWADPRELAPGSDALYTDVWVSMGQEDQSHARFAAFAGYCVDSALLDLAGPRPSRCTACRRIAVRRSPPRFSTAREASPSSRRRTDSTFRRHSWWSRSGAEPGRRSAPAAGRARRTNWHTWRRTKRRPCRRRRYPRRRLGRSHDVHMTDDLYERYKEALRVGHVAVLRGARRGPRGIPNRGLDRPVARLPHTSLGGVLLRLGHLEEALVEYAAAVARAPHDEGALLGQAEALTMAGQRVDAAAGAGPRRRDPGGGPADTAPEAARTPARDSAGDQAAEQLLELRDDRSAGFRCRTPAGFARPRALQRGTGRLRESPASLEPATRPAEQLLPANEPCRCLAEGGAPISVAARGRGRNPFGSSRQGSRNRLRRRPVLPHPPRLQQRRRGFRPRSSRSSRPWG